MSRPTRVSPPRVDLDALRRSVVLGTLPQEELAELARRMRGRTYRRGERIVRQGEPGDALYVLLRGRVKVVAETASGEEPVLTVLGPGELFGEMALLDGGPRAATVVALEAVHAAVLGRDDFRALLRRSPDAAERVLASLTGMIRRTSQQITDLLALTIPARLAKKLLELGAAHGRAVGRGANGTDVVAIEVPLTQEDLAAMVGGTRPTINKLLGTYEAAGAIVRAGRRITIVQPEILRRLAGG
jgi:CRP-like cAMP-binding protein